MIYTTLISALELSKQLNNSNWVIIDCQSSLADTEAGAKSYRMEHIPSAHYVHLDKDLSSQVRAFTGRHPLPDFTLLAKKLGLWGIDNSTQVIVYDNASGAFASRLWWLLRTMGHDAVAVLNGGLPEWKRHKFPLTTKLPELKDKTFRAYINSNSWLTATEVENGLATKTINLIDARSQERFLGINEPIDPVAGHIPGALNRTFQLNLDNNGLFLRPNIMQDQFNHLLKNNGGKQIVHMCGSGVTACHNLLAMEYAELYSSRLYAGSWSEWITSQKRNIRSSK